MDLTSENVEAVFKDCLFKEDEDTTVHIKVVGITINVGFHSSRLKSHREDVKTMLACLPDDFMQDKGGGMTFLNACNDRNGHQWTDLHQRMEQLFVLGIALHLCKFLMPRETWYIFPGGMPYVTVMT